MYYLSMKNLYEYINESILDDDLDVKAMEGHPIKFKKIKDWQFPNTSFGEVWDETKQIGFYEVYKSDRQHFVTLYTNIKLQEKWLDQTATNRYGEPIPIKSVCELVKKRFDLTGDENVFWWDIEDFYSNIDGGSVPELGDRKGELAWMGMMSKFKKFFGCGPETPISKQIRFSKGDYY